MAIVFWFQTMSLSTVLKNVYTFAQILGQANGSEAGLWDVQSLNNALKWAAYCQKVTSIHFFFKKWKRVNFVNFILYRFKFINISTKRIIRCHRNIYTFRFKIRDWFFMFIIGWVRFILRLHHIVPAPSFYVTYFMTNKTPPTNPPI